MKNVTADSSGRLNRIVRDLNRNTLDSLGQNLTKWSMANKPTRQQKMSALAHILDYDFDADRERTPYGSVSWRCLVYKIMKKKLALEYSTWASLQDMHRLTCTANTWFMSRGLRLEFLLVEQRDLESLLDLVYHPRLGVAASQSDIRQWLHWRGERQEIE